MCAWCHWYGHCRYVGTGGETVRGALVRFSLDLGLAQGHGILALDRSFPPLHAVAKGWVASPALGVGAMSPPPLGNGVRATGGSRCTRSPAPGKRAGGGNPSPAAAGGAPVLGMAAVSFDGTVHGLGADGARRWNVSRPGFEAHASPALGRFGGSGARSGVLDVVCAMHRGVFPSYSGGAVVWLDGATGAILHERTELVRAARFSRFSLFPASRLVSYAAALPAFVNQRLAWRLLHSPRSREPVRTRAGSNAVPCGIPC